MEHILKGAEPDNNWFRKAVRDFLDDQGVLPKKPKKGKKKFPIYDYEGNRYTAKFDHQGRIFCTDWYNHFNPEEGDKIIVRVENGERIIINPAGKEDKKQPSSDSEEKDDRYQQSDEPSESPSINIKVEINLYK